MLLSRRLGEGDRERVHKPQEGYIKEKIITQLVLRVAGEMVTLEMNPPGGFHRYYVRVRIKHGVRKPLTHFVSVSKILVSLREYLKFVESCVIECVEEMMSNNSSRVFQVYFQSRNFCSRVPDSLIS